MAGCTKCGKEVQEDEKFCKACGSSLAGSSHDEKKQRVLGAANPSQKTPLIIAIVVVTLAVGYFVFSSHSGRGKGGMIQAGARNSAPRAEYVTIAAESGEVRIPESMLEENKARYFTFTGNGKTVKFFVLRAEDGAIRVALDACAACYHAKLGYRQEGATMVCNNCGMGFRSTDAGKVTGGCSPIPVERKSENKMIVLQAAELEAGAKYFY